MRKKVYGIWFYYTVVPNDPTTNLHPYLYFSHEEAVANAKLETNNGKDCSYEIFDLEIFESNSVNFIRREDL